MATLLIIIFLAVTMTESMHQAARLDYNASHKPYTVLSASATYLLAKHSCSKELVTLGTPAMCQALMLLRVTLSDAYIDARTKFLQEMLLGSWELPWWHVSSRWKHDKSRLDVRYATSFHVWLV